MEAAGAHCSATSSQLWGHGLLLGLGHALRLPVLRLAKFVSDSPLTLMRSRDERGSCGSQHPSLSRALLFLPPLRVELEKKKQLRPAAWDAGWYARHKYVRVARRLLPRLLDGRGARHRVAARPAACRSRVRPRAPSQPPQRAAMCPDPPERDNVVEALRGQAAERLTAATPLPSPASLQDEGRNALEGTGAGFKAVGRPNEAPRRRKKLGKVEGGKES
uniref:Uncharacterized protein n=1 Tax=Sphaerodactylus townsendi TaxID=933632 RepID=A0ACB8F406_9SAUR